MNRLPARKHITLVIRCLNGRSGGAERIYCELANILDEAGYAVTCLHFDSRSGEPFYHLNAGVERINLYAKPSAWTKRLVFISKFAWKGMREKAQWSRENSFFIEQLRLYFTLVKPEIAISLLPPANTPTLMAAKGQAVRVIACNHNVPEQDYENPNRWGKTGIDRKLRVRALDNAAAIHVLFPVFAQWFPNHLKDRTVAIPNYISSGFSRQDPPLLRKKTILAVGRLVEAKNYLQLIRSWSALAGEFPDWKLRIVGIGPQIKEIEAEVTKFNLADAVELPGHLSDLSQEYATAAIFCHPALFEGFGLAPAEALYFGTPVVSYSDCSGVNQFVRDGHNGTVVERKSDQDMLAAALKRLIVDKDLRERLGRNGPASVSEFTMQHYRQRWISLIESLGTSK